MKQKIIPDNTKRGVYLKWLSGKFSLKELAQFYDISEHSVSKIISQKLERRKLSYER